MSAIVDFFSHFCMLDRLTRSIFVRKILLLLFYNDRAISGHVQVKHLAISIYGSLYIATDVRNDAYGFNQLIGIICHVDMYRYFSSRCVVAVPMLHIPLYPVKKI